MTMVADGDKITVLIEIDTAPFEAAMSAFTSAVQEMAAAFSNVLDQFVRRCAIVHYDIAESDIRSISGTAVRLWNHRRISIDLTRLDLLP